MLILKAATLCTYIASVVVANWVTDRFGFVPVGFGVSATAGTYAAGVALLSRDLVQDLLGRRAVLGAIATGALLSAWLATPQLALASGVSFLVAETADMAVYTPLRRRGWARAVLASNAVGAVLDTMLFLWLAGFAIAAAAPGQLIGKMLWATVIPVILVTLVRCLRASRRETATTGEDSEDVSSNRAAECVGAVQGSDAR